MMCGLSDAYVHSIMEFLRANSILRFDFVVISIRYVWFALFTFYVSPIYTIHEVSEWVSDWLCTRSNGQAIHSPVYNINWYIRLKWTRRALPSKRKLNFRRCTSFFPAVFSSFRDFVLCALSRCWCWIWFLCVLFNRCSLLMCCFCVAFVLYFRLRSFFITTLLIAHFEITRQEKKESSRMEGKSVWGGEANSFLNNNITGKIEGED